MVIPNNLKYLTFHNLFIYNELIAFLIKEFSNNFNHIIVNFPKINLNFIIFYFYHYSLISIICKYFNLVRYFYLFLFINLLSIV